MDALGARGAAAPEMDRASRDLAVIAEVGRSLIGIIDLDQQLGQILSIAIDALGGDRGSIMLADASQQQLEVRCGVGLPATASSATTRFGEGIAGWVAEHREPVVLHGGVSDPRFEGRDASIGSALSLPLMVDEALIGVLNLVRSAGDRFTDEDLRLASSLADMSSLAIEKSQLHSALKEREARVSQLLAAAIGAQEKERTRIAADIHDGFLQDLSALFLKAESAKIGIRRGDMDQITEAVEGIQEMIRNEVGALRDYIFEVRPPSLDEIGLAPTLAAMVQRVAGDSSVEGTFEDLTTGSRLSKPVETIIYRTAQEALRNITKHAAARRVDVKLETNGDSATLTVDDDGSGINPDVMKKNKHFGIETMRERVELAGGTFEIAPMPTEGTRVRAVIPLDAT